MLEIHHDKAVQASSRLENPYSRVRSECCYGAGKGDYD